MALSLAARTDVTQQAERLVRDPSLFKWYAVALLAFVIYVYANEVERRRWDIVAAGAAVWLGGIQTAHRPRPRGMGPAAGQAGRHAPCACRRNPALSLLCRVRARSCTPVSGDLDRPQAPDRRLRRAARRGHLDL